MVDDHRTAVWRPLAMKKTLNRKISAPRRVLRLPDLDYAKMAVLEFTWFTRLSSILQIRDRRFHSLVLF